jgi:1-acyl-sn-glycerol-3-phosphate acyltransferase
LKVPLLGTFIKKLGSILIDRDSPTSGAIALKNFARITQTGDVITIFPEGTRSIDGKVNEFKKGSLLVPYRYNIKILPVTIDGTIGMNKKGSILIKPGKVKLYIHNVIEPKTFSSEAELRAHVQNVISRQIAQNSLTKAS